MQLRKKGSASQSLGKDNNNNGDDVLMVTMTLKIKYENKMNASRQRLSNEILSGVKNSSPTYGTPESAHA